MVGDINNESREGKRGSDATDATAQLVRGAAAGLPAALRSAPGAALA